MVLIGPIPDCCTSMQYEANNSTPKNDQEGSIQDLVFGLLVMITW